MERRNFVNGAGIFGAGALLQGFSARADAASSGSGGATRLVAARTATAAVKRAADFVCTGVRDDVVINRALRSCGVYGGVVRLSRGEFDIRAAVRMPKRTGLVGEGPATNLKARGTWRSFDRKRVGAVVEPLHAGVDKTSVRLLAIDGNRSGRRASVGGIYYSITRGDLFDEGPDASHIFADIYIHETNWHGLHVAGGRARATQGSNIRVFNAGDEAVGEANGLRIESPDGTWVGCDVGSSASHGVYVAATNNRFTACKSWYSRGDGWHIRNPRNMLSSSEAQDNAGHGFYIGSGPNTFVGCHADSNSWRRDAPVSDGDGFHLPWSTRVQLMGCSAYDKNESQRGHWQRYGVFLGSASEHCQIMLTTDANVAGGIGGAGVDNANNVIMVSG